MKTKKFVIMLMTAMLLLTACGGSSGSENVLHVAKGGDARQLDPAIVSDSITANILQQMYEGLYSLDKDGYVVADLAVGAPEVSADGLVYTIKVKEGVKWSDGEPLVAEHFIYAWKRSVSMGVIDAYYSQFISNNVVNAVDGAPLSEMGDFGAKALDEHTIEITLKAPVPYFEAVLTSTVFTPVRQDFIDSKGDDYKSSTWADDVEAPVLGAFKPESINIKDEIVLVKNDEYYDADKVKLDGVTFKVMADQDSQVNAFATGDIDFATSVNRESALKDDMSESLFVIDPYVVNYYILVNSGEENDGSTDALKALKDPEVRRAISLGVDRKAMLQVLGYGDLAYELHGLVPKGIPGVAGDFRTEADDKDLLAYTDVAAAKAIMEAKGYGPDNMLAMKYAYNDNQMHKDVSQSLQASLKEIYIDLTLETQEVQAFFAERDKGNFELARHAMSADFIDPMAYLSMYYGFDLAANTVDSAEFEKLVDEANAKSDAERMEGLHKAEEYLVKDQSFVIPLFGYSDPYLLNSKVKGITSSPEGRYVLKFAEFAE